MITTSLISASETSTETQTEVTNAIEGIIANAVSTTAKETGRLSKLISGIADKIKEALPSLIFAVIIFLIGLALSKIILRIFTRCLNRANVDITAVGFLRSLLKVLLYTIDFIITLSILNIPMTSIIAVISAAGLAIGLALQNSLSNLAGGFIILSPATMLKQTPHPERWKVSEYFTQEYLQRIIKLFISQTEK